MSETYHTATCTTRRLLGNGCYTKLRDIQQGKTSQTTTITILDFGGSTPCKPALGQNIPTGSKKQTETYSRSVRMHLLGHGMI